MGLEEHFGHYQVKLCGYYPQSILTFLDTRALYEGCSCTRQFWVAGACTRQFSGLVLHSDFFVWSFLLMAKSCTCQLKSLTMALDTSHTALNFDPRVGYFSKNIILPRGQWWHYLRVATLVSKNFLYNTKKSLFWFNKIKVFVNSSSSKFAAKFAPWNYFQKFDSLEISLWNQLHTLCNAIFFFHEVVNTLVWTKRFPKFCDLTDIVQGIQGLL